MLRHPWSTTAAAIGAIDARDATVTTVGTMTAVTTMMAIADADIDTDVAKGEVVDDDARCRRRDVKRIPPASPRRQIGGSIEQRL
jgi:hypothetical protein